MLPASAERILAGLPDDAVVLDVGGGASPFPRADWVIDLLPYDERGRYGYDDATARAERFGPERWVCRDICDKEPFPFGDDEIDFVVCSHTLEDVRDPIWVCQEMMRVARAGYLETPSRLEEQSWGVHGPWVGWSHHRWLVEAQPGRVEFTFKHHVICGRSSDHFPPGFWASLTPEERVVAFDWEGSFEVGERIFWSADELDAYVGDFVSDELAQRGLSSGPRSRARRAWSRARRARLPAPRP